jgi:aryl-alcohol dehydrogenase-like predicted oxidoreductase
LTCCTSIVGISFDRIELDDRDYTTSIEELAHSLDSLVKRGKVLYLGITDTPAWIVSQYNQYAKDHVHLCSKFSYDIQSLRPFSVYAGHWNCSYRDMEREVIPMARTLSLAIVPWGAVGGGKFKTEAQIAELKNRTDQGPEPRSDADLRIIEVLEKLAKSRSPDIGLNGIALAYVRHKAPDVFPLVGGQKIQDLKEDIEALNVRLSDAEMKEIDDAGGVFKMGFPYNLVGGGEPGATAPKDVSLLRAAGHYDFPDIRMV